MTAIYEVEILEQGHGYSLKETCRRINLEEDFVVQCVDYGIAPVSGQAAGDWLFTPASIARIQRAWRLQRDLEINFTGLGVVVDLLDEMEDLRRKVSVLEKKLRHWEP